MTHKKIRHVPRRGFLGLIGTAPFAAKQLVAEAAAGVESVGADAVRSGRSFHPMGSPTGRKTRSALARLISEGKVPEFQRVRWWKQARGSARLLDPDLATMRSPSLSQKIRLQTERNYQRRLDEYLDQIGFDTAWKSFAKQVLGRELTEDDDEYYD